MYYEELKVGRVVWFRTTPNGVWRIKSCDEVLSPLGEQCGLCKDGKTNQKDGSRKRAGTLKRIA